MAKSANPRISLNKLGEYSEANSNRRKQIIKDAKDPKAFKMVRYKDARDGIASYLKRGQDPEVINRAIERIRAKPRGSDFIMQDRNLSITVLELVAELELGTFNEYEIQSPSENELLNFSGVDVSIAPDILLYKEIKGVMNVGAIKLILSRTHPLSNDCMRTVSAVTHMYVSDHIIERGQVANSKMCFSFDPFIGAIEHSPNTYVNRIRNLHNCCEEIALRWPTS